MPPRVRIKREDVILAVVDLVRKSGGGAINARDVASALNCSTQPIFSNFANMDELKFCVLEKIDEICRGFIKKEVESGRYPAYKASGMGYIRFAKEEKELFKFLYMRNRVGENFPEKTDLNDEMEDHVQKNTGLDGEKKKLFHLEMWAFVHGIASMFATDFLDLEWELVSKMITDAYQGLKKQYSGE